MVDIFEDTIQKRDQYLQLMQQAKQLNDQGLIQLIVKKLAYLGITNAISTTNGCTIIPFPTDYNPHPLAKDEPLTWWLIVKLTLAIPGSMVALFLLSYYSM